MTKVFRIQDRAGRGPFKPNVTKKWLSYSPEKDRLPSVQDSFPNILELLRADRGMIYACACLDTKSLHKWFTFTEYRKLKKLGYRCVTLDVEIVASDDLQCLIKSKYPLNKICQPYRLYNV